MILGVDLRRRLERCECVETIQVDRIHTQRSRGDSLKGCERAPSRDEGPAV